MATYRYRLYLWSLKTSIEASVSTHGASEDAVSSFDLGFDADDKIQCSGCYGLLSKKARQRIIDIYGI